MLIYDVLQKERAYQIIATDLRGFGVKYSIKKNALKLNKKPNVLKKVFKTHLSYQALDVVNLSSGGIVHVPVFVSHATAYLEKYITQEGLFRKAGSQNRQKELISRLDNGGSLGDKHNAIDVANCLKTFFRDLPEPLIPYCYHDLFVRCGMLKSNRMEALLLACLLLPPHHLNTLAFFMDFLKKVAMYENQNKMSIDNLAKVIGPNLMPLQDTTMSAVQTRLEIHLLIVKSLIENAKEIGVLPDHISEVISTELVSSIENDLDRSDSLLRSKSSKKKKHRSGSLTRKTPLSASNLNLRMFNGLKKMVGKNASPGEPMASNNQLLPTPTNALSTPSIKTGKKRKVPEVAESPNSKKKREMLEVMPDSTCRNARYLFGSPVSNDPNPKERSRSPKSRVRKYLPHKVHSEVRVCDKIERTRKLRLSLDRFVSKSKQKLSEIPSEAPENSTSPILERRWSSASSSSKKRRKTTADDLSSGPSKDLVDEITLNVKKDYDELFMDADVNLSDDCGEPVSSLKRNNSIRKVVENEQEYVRIPKSEYEEIKNRVSAIESRISQEFGSIANENENCNIIDNSSLNNVQSVYEKTLEEASIENTITADHLAKRLGKELKIRRSTEHKIIRSPSARKIGSLRRRSQEKPIRRVNRTASWHVSGGSDFKNLMQAKQLKNLYTQTKKVQPLNPPLYTNLNNEDPSRSSPDIFCSDETNARLNYLQEQLRTLISHTVEHTKESFSDDELNSLDCDDDVFEPAQENNTMNSVKVRRASSFHGNEFIDNSRYFNRKVKELKKSNSQQNVGLNNYVHEKTQKENLRDIKNVNWKDADGYFKSMRTVTPVHQTGRASVAKLRAQNAGMVLAKVKLFDETTNKDCEVEDKSLTEVNKSRAKLRRSKDIRSLDLDLVSSSPGRTKITATRRSPKNEDKEKLNRRHSLRLERQKLTYKKDDSFEIVRENNRFLNTPPLVQKVSVNTILQESNMNIYKSDVIKTPHIKRPLATKTPKSSKSLVRNRPIVDSRRTPLKAVAGLQNNTPKRQSPKSVLKTRHLSRHIN